MGDPADIFAKQYMLTAGPTPLPPRVSQVMAEPILYHRAPAFVEVYARCLERLPRIFQTRNPVLCFAASGTGAMESAVANLIRPGDTAVAASCGKFGERWAEMCDAYGAATTHVEFEYGEKVDPRAPRRRHRRAPREPAGRVRHPVRDLDRGGQRHPGPQRGRTRPRRRALRRRDLGPRCRRPAAGRVGGRRGRVGLAEVAHVPARARLRLGLRARYGARGRAAGRPLLLRLGEDRCRSGRRSRRPPRSPRP